MKPLATVRSIDGYNGLQAALRARSIALGMSGEDMDEISGLATRNALKLLAPVPIKGIGKESLGPLLGALGVMLIVVEDEEMLAKISKRYTKRTTRRPDANDGMPTKRKRKRKHFLKGCTEWGKLMAARRMLVSTERQRSIRARNAARAKWRKAKPTKQYVGITNAIMAK